MESRSLVSFLCSPLGRRWSLVFFPSLFSLSVGLRERNEEKDKEDARPRMDKVLLFAWLWGCQCIILLLFPHRHRERRPSMFSVSGSMSTLMRLLLYQHNKEDFITQINELNLELTQESTFAEFLGIKQCREYVENLLSIIPKTCLVCIKTRTLWKILW